jgi:hypothetical protein
MNTFELSHWYFSWAFENPNKAKPIHAALFFYIIEHGNRMGWAKQFGLPSEYAASAIGVKKSQTVLQTLKDLHNYGFITIEEYSKNQWTANIISINAAPSNVSAQGTALGTAQGAARVHQGVHQGAYNKTVNNETNKQQKEILFDTFWNLYDKKEGYKKAQAKWMKLPIETMQLIIQKVPSYVQSTPDKQFRKLPLTYLNGEHWNDEIINKPAEQGVRYNYLGMRMSEVPV